MPTITFRLDESEKTDLEILAHKAGQSVSEYIRATLLLREFDESDSFSRLEAVEERLRRLEEIAGL